jgi:hypothetical protein
VSVAVMAHPRRAHLVADLCRRLDYPAPVIFDERDDRWDTGSRALLAYDPSATHHVVVQDDAVVCRDLTAGVAELVAHVPAGRPIGLYFGRGRPGEAQHAALYRRAVRAGHRWIAMTRGPMWGVALVVPTDQCRPLVEHGNRNRSISYDGRVASWYRKHGIECWYPIPSLVDHRNDPEVPSLIGGQKGRAAHEHLGDRSPLDVDWATGVTR